MARKDRPLKNPDEPVLKHVYQIDGGLNGLYVDGKLIYDWDLSDRHAPGADWERILDALEEAGVLNWRGGFWIEEEDLTEGAMPKEL